LLLATAVYPFSLTFLKLSGRILVNMSAIRNMQTDTAIDIETKREMSNMDMGEDEAINKVEAATSPDQNAQNGVRNVEAVTLTWTKKSLASAFVWYVPYSSPTCTPCLLEIERLLTQTPSFTPSLTPPSMWFLYLTNAFQSSITSNLTPYVTSSFSSHSLLTVITIVSNSMAAAVYIPTAKLLDLWGRAEGFAFMVCFATLGLILMAVCTSLPTFCAAQVFYTIGFGGMTYCVDVITADASSLKHRGLAFAFTSSPYIITAFAGPKAAEGFYERISWRWGFGTFAAVLPVVAAPLFAILKMNLKRARREGVLVREEEKRTWMQSVVYHVREFDGKCYVHYSTESALTQSQSQDLSSLPPAS
jgi:hypothetical protein